MRVGKRTAFREKEGGRNGRRHGGLVLLPAGRLDVETGTPSVRADSLPADTPAAAEGAGLGGVTQAAPWARRKTAAKRVTSGVPSIAFSRALADDRRRLWASVEAWAVFRFVTDFRWRNWIRAGRYMQHRFRREWSIQLTPQSRCTFLAFREQLYSRRGLATSDLKPAETCAQSSPAIKRSSSISGDRSGESAPA